MSLVIIIIIIIFIAFGSMFLFVQKRLETVVVSVAVVSIVSVYRVQFGVLHVARSGQQVCKSWPISGM